MQFKTLTVHREGPIENLTVEFGGVNLIVGDNEEGKTTLTDILVRRLLGDAGKRSRGSQQLLRAGRFKSDKAESFECSGKDFDERTKEFVRLLVVREGENRLTGRDEQGLDDAAFWNTDVKDMIYGRDGIYSKLSADFKKTLGVSTAASWMNLFLERLDSAKQELDVQLQNVAKLKTNRETVARYAGQLETLRSRLGILEQSRNRSEDAVKLRTARRYFALKDELREAAAKLDALKQTDWDTLGSQWSGTIQRLKQLEFQINEGKLKYEYGEERILQFEKELDRIEAGIGDTERELEFLRTSRNDLRTRSASRTRLAPWLALTVVCLALIAFGILGLLKLVFASHPLSLWASLAMLVPGGLGFLAGFAGLIAGIAKSPTVSQASVRGAKGIRDIDSLESELAGLDEDLADYKNELAEALAAHDSLRAELKSLGEESARLLERDADFARKYHSYENVIRNKANRDSEQAAFATLEKNYADAAEEAFRAFGTDSDSRIHEETARLERKLKDSGETAADFDEEEYQSLRKQSQDLQDGIARLREENKGLKGVVETSVASTLSAIPKTHENVLRFYPAVERLGLMGDIFNIDGLRSELEKLAGTVKRDAEASGAIADAFDRANSRVEELLEAVLDKPAFRHALVRLTAGNYSGVRYEISDKKIDLMLVRRDGTEFHLKDLSTGARNQFSLAARFALAAEEFDGGDTVMILDDAFLTFDHSRRVSSVEFLKELADKGWQIVYSSVNDTIMEKIFDKVFGKNYRKIVL